MENEEYFCENVPAMIWVAGADGVRTHFNKRWLDFTGRPAQSQLNNGWTEAVHPDDVHRCLGIYSSSFDRRQEFKAEFRLRRHDGEYRWVCESGVPRFDPDGSFAGYIGSCFDITDSRLATEALSRAVGRLIEVQEYERTRIARELHNDIGSSLAVLGIDLLKATQPEVQAIYEKMQEIGSRISRLSNELRPPMLKYFGLAKAIDAECRNFSEESQIPVSFSCKEIPAKLDPVLALTFFRVLQEALDNAGKHSHATSVTVDLAATSTELTLAVSDDGVGFDVGQIHLAAGVGLIITRERTRLVGGTFEIWSQPGQGSKLSCRAPLVLSKS